MYIDTLNCFQPGKCVNNLFHITWNIAWQLRFKTMILYYCTVYGISCGLDFFFVPSLTSICEHILCSWNVAFLLENLIPEVVPFEVIKLLPCNHEAAVFSPVHIVLKLSPYGTADGVQYQVSSTLWSLNPWPLWGGQGGQTTLRSVWANWFSQLLLQNTFITPSLQEKNTAIQGLEQAHANKRALKYPEAEGTKSHIQMLIEFPPRHWQKIAGFSLKPLLRSSAGYGDSSQPILMNISWFSLPARHPNWPWV